MIGTVIRAERPAPCSARLRDRSDRRGNRDGIDSRIAECAGVRCGRTFVDRYRRIVRRNTRSDVVDRYCRCVVPRAVVLVDDAATNDSRCGAIGEEAGRDCRRCDRGRTGIGSVTHFKRAVVVEVIGVTKSSGRIDARRIALSREADRARRAFIHRTAV